MNNNYVELKERQQKEVNEFPMGFAFSNEQLKEGMEKLNVSSTDELLSIGAGGFIRKTDREAFKNMMARHNKEFNEAIEADTTGEGFIYQMFNYELANHEYCITWDVSDTLESLGITREDIKKNKNLENGLNRAKGRQWEISERESLQEQIEEWIYNNTEQTMYIISEINSYNDSLDFLDFRENDEYFFQELFCEDVIAAVRMTQNEDYNLNHEYVVFGGDGNLISYTQEEAEKEINIYKDDVAIQIIKLKDDLELPAELQEIFEAEEEWQQEREEERQFFLN